MLILGLDISTTTTGICLLEKINNKTFNLLYMNYVDLSDQNSLYEKAQLVKNELIKIKEKYTINSISVEESLQKFSMGFSSAKTLSLLTKFNGIICYICQDLFNVEINYHNVLHVRSKLGIKLNKEKKNSKKIKVLEHIKSYKEFSSFVWPEKVIQSGKNKGQTKILEQSYDMADAAMMALYEVLF